MIKASGERSENSKALAGGRLPRSSGFSLIEVMVALTLGLLLSAGIITIFSSTSKANKVQNALARLQENGRYAMTRIGADLRMLSGQYCSNFSGNSRSTANGPQVSGRAPWIYSATLALPDAGAPLVFTTASPVSPRLFVQGYECGSGTCAPTVPSGTGQIPNVGTSDGNRLKGTDVLTIRYVTGTGWPVSTTAPPNCTTGGNIALAPQTGDDNPEVLNPPRPKFAAGDLALISDCQNPSLLPVAGYGSNLMTLAPLLPGGAGGGPYCTASANRDTRVFNFTQNFVTVSYYIELVRDQNPDATAGRMIPVLVRRENGQRQELVQGVERLDFLYGVRDVNGAIRYLTADQVNTQSSAANCIAPPDGVTLEAGCLWRSIKNVEVHALFNTVDDTGLSPVDMAFRYSIDGPTLAPPSGTASAVTGLAFGKMMRREFVSSTTVRNAN